jgi:hypothetical protein
MRTVAEVRKQQIAERRPAERLSKTARALAGLQAFIGLGALAGGIGFVTAPDGSNMGMTVDSLLRGPFTDYLIPGLVLITMVGGTMFVAAAAILKRSRWAVELSVTAGAVLMVWIAVQVAIMGLVSWLQPLYFLLGVATAGLALLLRRS